MHVAHPGSEQCFSEQMISCQAYPTVVLKDIGVMTLVHSVIRPIQTANSTLKSMHIRVIAQAHDQQVMCKFTHVNNLHTFFVFES